LLLDARFTGPINILGLEYAPAGFAAETVMPALGTIPNNLVTIAILA